MVDSARARLPWQETFRAPDLFQCLKRAAAGLHRGRHAKIVHGEHGVAARRTEAKRTNQAEIVRRAIVRMVVVRDFMAVLVVAVFICIHGDTDEIRFDSIRQLQTQAAFTPSGISSARR